MKPLQLIGKRFGLLSVVAQAPSAEGATRWICVCVCGSRREYSRQTLMSTPLRAGRSCGCVSAAMAGARLRRHGPTNTPEWRTWSSMFTRCYNARSVGYRYWGGRGVKVCSRWHTFENFLADMGRRPAGTSLDRINNDGNYSSRNCRWATTYQQAQNKRDTRFIEWSGKRRSVAQWSRELRIPIDVLCKRLDSGRPLAWVLTRPVRKGFHPMDAI